MGSRNGRRIFVGDLQGCRAELDALLKKLRLTVNDQFYAVGDLVNRGPDSLGVLRRLREIGAKTVLGNHDFLLLRIAAGSVEVRHDHPLRAVLAAKDADTLLDWLRAQPVLLIEDDIAVVHGGLHPQWHDLPAIARRANPAVARHVSGVTNQTIDFAIHVRHCDANGSRPPTDDPPPGPPFKPWDSFYTGKRTVVFGHWARRGLVHGLHVRGLDTGCVYGGPLTAWIAEENRFVASP